MALPNYVKFQRGTLVAYNRLSQKDENTLYFIYDAEDETKGTLYLGARLIGSVGGSGGVNNLSELSDVLVSEARTGDFLVLNSEGKWTSTSASGVAEAILSAGGQFIEIDEDEFTLNPVNSNKLELKGYSTAATGLVPTKGSTGITWVSLPPDLSSRVGNLETSLNASTTAISQIQTELAAVDGKITNAIASANHLSYQVVNDLSAATAENVIYLYDNGSVEVNNHYEEYLLTNGSLERIGSTAIDLSQYATVTAVSVLDTRVGNLETTVGSLTTAVSTIQTNMGNFVLTSTFNAVIGDLSSVNGTLNNLNADDSIADTLIDIYDRLTWQEMT